MLYGYRHNICQVYCWQHVFTQLLSSGQFEEATVCIWPPSWPVQGREVSLHGLGIPPVTGNLSVMNDSCGSPQRTSLSPTASLFLSIAHSLSYVLFYCLCTSSGNICFGSYTLLLSMRCTCSGYSLKLTQVLDIEGGA